MYLALELSTVHSSLYTLYVFPVPKHDIITQIWNEQIFQKSG